VDAHVIFRAAIAVFAARDEQPAALRNYSKSALSRADAELMHLKLIHRYTTLPEMKVNEVWIWKVMRGQCYSCFWENIGHCSHTCQINQSTK
jgi:hypothetical protein